MESFVAGIAHSDLPMLVTHLERECEKSGPGGTAVGSAAHDKDVISAKEMSFNEVENVQNQPPERSAVVQAWKTLSQFIDHVTQHWSLLQAPILMQQEVAREILKFFMAHINHNNDSVSLAKSKCRKKNNAQERVSTPPNYLAWVRSTASDDTSCPFSFLFFVSLISERGRDHLEDPRASYFSKSLCGHLATMWRQYNDYGSAERDAAECNLDSLDFPEFYNVVTYVDGPRTANGSSSASDGDASLAHPSNANGAWEAIQGISELSGGEENIKDATRLSAKDHLLSIAEFERSCMELAMRKLTEILPSSTTGKLRVFIDITDMFGQIYVQKDIASRVKNRPQ